MIRVPHGIWNGGLASTYTYLGAGVALGPVNTSGTLGPVNTDRVGALRALGALIALGAGGAGGASLALRALGALIALGALGAGGAGGASLALGPVLTVNTDRVGALRALGTGLALGTSDRSAAVSLLPLLEFHVGDVGRVGADAGLVVRGSGEAVGRQGGFHIADVVLDGRDLSAQATVERQGKGSLAKMERRRREENSPRQAVNAGARGGVAD